MEVVLKPIGHEHTWSDEPTLDRAGFEKVCTTCGEVAPTEITEFDKLSGCLDADGYNNLRFGAPTPVFLQSFLLPTLRRIKCRDRYVDIKILSKLKVYTDLLGICERAHIPKDYADETMRILLKRKKGLYSKYVPTRVLIGLLKFDKRLMSRIPILIFERRCARCKKVKRLTEFSNRTKKSLVYKQNYCKTCAVAYITAQRKRKRRKKK
jgi:hypothetical protein